MYKVNMLSALILCLGIFGINDVAAHGHGGGYYGGHHGGGLYIGPSFGFYSGFGYPAPYYSPYYAYPPNVTIVPPSPPVYIERPAPVAPNYPPNFWYYCRNPDGYYPYVKECPNGWVQVPARPPGQ